MTILKQLPALVVLQRIPNPALAIASDDSILFANVAFAEMLGSTSEALRSLKFHDLLYTLCGAEPAIDHLRAHNQVVVELMHVEGWTVSATMNKSALLRRDDPVALATFQDVTEQLWTTEGCPALKSA